MYNASAAPHEAYVHVHVHLYVTHAVYIPPHVEDIEYFSAERECPNNDFGFEGCKEPWNIFTNVSLSHVHGVCVWPCGEAYLSLQGTSLSFSDFGDFPIFALLDPTFTVVREVHMCCVKSMGIVYTCMYMYMYMVYVCTHVYVYSVTSHIGVGGLKLEGKKSQCTPLSVFNPAYICAHLYITLCLFSLRTIHVSAAPPLPPHSFSSFLPSTLWQCFENHNTNGDGGIIDYPLCAAEMVADMLTAKNTETCFRRGTTVQCSVHAGA